MARAEGEGMSKIKEVLEEFIGQKLLYVSSNDPGEESFAMLMFEGGGAIKITLADACIEEFEYGEDTD